MLIFRNNRFLAKVTFFCSYSTHIKNEFLASVDNVCVKNKNKTNNFYLLIAVQHNIICKDYIFYKQYVLPLENKLYNLLCSVDKVYLINLFTDHSDTLTVGLTTNLFSGLLMGDDSLDISYSGFDYNVITNNFYFRYLFKFQYDINYINDIKKNIVLSINKVYYKLYNVKSVIYYNESPYLRDLDSFYLPVNSRDLDFILTSFRRVFLTFHGFCDCSFYYLNSNSLDAIKFISKLIILGVVLPATSVINPESKKPTLSKFSGVQLKFRSDRLIGWKGFVNKGSKFGMYGYINRRFYSDSTNNWKISNYSKFDIIASDNKKNPYIDVYLLIVVKSDLFTPDNIMFSEQPNHSIKSVSTILFNKYGIMCRLLDQLHDNQLLSSLPDFNEYSDLLMNKQISYIPMISKQTMERFYLFRYLYGFKLLEVFKKKFELTINKSLKSLLNDKYGRWEYLVDFKKKPNINALDFKFLNSDGGDTPLSIFKLFDGGCLNVDDFIKRGFHINDILYDDDPDSKRK